MFTCSKMHRWKGRWVLALSLRDKVAMSKFELTVKTGSHLTHTHDLEKGVSFDRSISFGLWGYREEKSSLSAYQGEDHHVVVGEYLGLAQTTSKKP